MSKLETSIQDHLAKNNVLFELQKPMPLKEWPWKTQRSKQSPKCDLYLPTAQLYVEMKGYMTLYAISKMSWLCKQDFSYYIFQGTEDDWNPYIESPLKNLSATNKTTSNIEHQISELVYFSQNSATLSS